MRGNDFEEDQVVPSNKLDWLTSQDILTFIGPKLQCKVHFINLTIIPICIVILG